MLNKKISVFKDLFKSTDVPYLLKLREITQRISEGKSKGLIQEIRKGNTDLKKKLPCILFAGEFKERNSKGLVKHSGLMVTDFDKYPDKNTMLEHLEELKQNPHFVLLFISPSGNGIKGVVRVPENLDKETHPRYFKAFQKAFKFDYFDIANSNVDRVCYESFDPNIYINETAEIFEAEIIDEGYSYTERPGLLPISSENEIINKIMAFDWRKDFIEGERNAFIFDIAGAFCEYGVNQSTAEGFILNNVVIGEFKESEALTSIASAYKKREFDSKYFEDYSRLNHIKNDLKNGKAHVIDKFKINEETYNEIQEEISTDPFWYFDKRDNVKINNFKFKLFLQNQGFKKYFPNETLKPTWVYIESNKVTETSVEKIKDHVLNFLLEIQEIKVWDYCVKYATLFSETYLLLLDSIELNMLRDEKYKSYIAFNNGILEITKDNINLIGYLDIESYVWKSHIIDRDFILTNKSKNDYKKFVENIGGEDPTPLECVIGYLLTTYKNKMNNKAIILNDEVISENPEGGTGKGLFIQGIKQIRRVSVLDGKSHDDKKSFPYQTVSQDSQVIVFDDVKKNFDFESKFSLVTEGMTIERKNKDAIKLTVEDSPKMVITTNYAIKGEGNSHDRRRHEIEIAQYYGKNITPYNEFGSQLFDDWDLDEFQSFDNYMIFCLQSYLKFGLIEQQAKNVKTRRFIMETALEFMEWAEDREHLTLNIRHNKTNLYDNFITEFPDFKKWLTRKRFNIFLQKYASFKGYEFNQGNTNGERWFSVDSVKNINKKIEDEVPF